MGRYVVNGNFEMETDMIMALLAGIGLLAAWVAKRIHRARTAR
jgi:hypothetical protein